GVWPGYYSKAKGCEVWDLDGNRYLDMSISGIGANVLGYADPDVDEAVLRAIRDGVSSSLNCPEEVELAELLCDLHPWADMVRYARTGGEAMALAVRVARASTSRDVVAFCGYHGWHDWYLAANLGTENALGEHLLSGLSPNGVPQGLRGTALPFRYNRLVELQDIVAREGGNLAAIVMEPIRSAQPEPGFLEGVRSLADECGAVLIVDEISAGFRLCTGGAHLTLGLEPDMAVFSKALGNGYAMAAIIGKAAVMEAVQDTFISSTNWTERVGPAAALATVAKHRRLDAGPHLCRMGEVVQQGWIDAAARHGLGIEVGGIAPLSHFSFRESDGQALKALFVQLMLERGFLASTLFYAMRAHEQEHVVAYLAGVGAAFQELAAAQEKGIVDRLLTGKPATLGFSRLV
ncbi:MAG: aminotransferase class III, partial [Desulfovibrio sp.]|nr:aminotransferase class III [Desulfovibrio sp.]